MVNSQCEDNNACTKNICQPLAGVCIFPSNVPSGFCCDSLTGELTPSTCDDNNECTRDDCFDDTCFFVGLTPPGSCCNPMTGELTPCSGNDDGDGCTLKQCDEATGACLLIDVRTVACDSDEDCFSFSSFSCGTVNPGFCDCACGNGIMEGEEECDEGGETSTCDIDCTHAICGDEHVNPLANEECDDGDACACDGCENDCTIGVVCGCVCFSDIHCRNNLPPPLNTTVCPDDNACNCATCSLECGHCVFTCSRFGDVDCSQDPVVNLQDILCALRGFSDFANCHNADIAPCSGNGLINLGDILGVLEAFSGQNPCGCAENTAPGTGVAGLCGSSQP